MDSKIINPYEVDTENLDWLELGKLPDVIFNPLQQNQLVQVDPVQEMIDIFSNPEYLVSTTKLLLNVDLPPYQGVILDTLWRRRLPILIGARGASKSHMLAVYALLRMTLHQGCKIVIVGAGMRQARQVFDYMVGIWEKAPVLRDLAGRSKSAGPRREIDRYAFEIGSSITSAIPIGSGDKIRGMRANYILADEYQSLNEEIFNTVIQAFAVVASNPIEKIKEAAMIKRMKGEGLWTDEMQALYIQSIGGNQIVHAGTADYTFKHFYKKFKIWHDIIRSKGDAKKMSDLLGVDNVLNKGFNWKDYAILRIPYSEIPEGLMDSGILAQAKSSLSRVQFLTEYSAIFSADSDGFYRRSIIEDATTNKPITLTTGETIQFRPTKVGDPTKGHVIAVDPAAEQDNAAIVVLELNQDHRKILYCWTTNRKRYNDLKKVYKDKGIELGDDYYRFIAKKIRELMRRFNTERVVIDKHGGGIAVEEALSSRDTCNGNELPLYPVVDEEEEKPTDFLEGLHILQMLAMSSESNSDANHGMLKDLQNQTLLFPMFDSIELARSIEIDNIEENLVDTYEDLLNEIEELKNELSSITVTASSALGKETFDVPGAHNKKNKKRKDRYSALLYGNYYARLKGKNEVVKIDYRATGGTKDTIKKTMGYDKGMMYYGPGTLKFGDSNWLKTGGTSYKRR